MKLNRLGFLSLFAIIGVLGLVSDNKGLTGFFGYAYYIRYFFVIPDELFITNIRKAASFGFFSGILATGIALILHILFPGLLSNAMILASCYVVSVFCFTFALIVLEIKEMGGIAGDSDN